MQAMLLVKNRTYQHSWQHAVNEVNYCTCIIHCQAKCTVEEYFFTCWAILSSYTVQSCIYKWNKVETRPLIMKKVSYTRLTAPCPGLSGWAGTRKVKPIWILLKQETVSGSGVSWAICKSATCSRQITMPAPHHSEKKWKKLVAIKKSKSLPAGD